MIEDDAKAENRLRLIFALRQAGIRDAEVLRALELTDRADFHDNRFRAKVHEDIALPITHGQHLLPPSIAAKMIQALELSNKYKILEVGTGTGYTTAILSRLARRVYSVERIGALALDARARLTRLGYRNVTVIAGDGSQGLIEQAPFDRIIVTAAADDPPRSLLAQLRAGGIMVLAVGQSDPVQALIKVVKGENGLEYEELGQTRIDPLVEGRE